MTTDLHAAQLSGTVNLLASLERVEQYFLPRHRELSELVAAMAGELREAAAPILLASAGTGPAREFGSARWEHAGPRALDSALDACCAYARETSMRIACAAYLRDSELMLRLEKIWHVANAGIWFLDLYRNAITVGSPLSRLPAWGSTNGLRTPNFRHRVA